MNDKDYQGRFGWVECDNKSGIAVKTTYGFYKRSQEELEKAKEKQPRDEYFRDRCIDIMLDHPFLLPTLGVEIDQNQQESDELAAGLRITMPLCRLSYKSEAQKIEEKAPQLAYLFEIYKKNKENPEWIAYVAELVLNLATAVQFLHEKDLVHLDIKENNVLVHTIEPLDLKVEGLFEKTRVYLADRGGVNINYYLTYANPIQGRDKADTGATNLQTKVLETQIDGNDPRSESVGKEKRIKKDIRRLGSLATYLLTGDKRVIVYRDFPLDESVYKKRNTSLETADFLIHALRKAAIIETEDITSSRLDEKDKPYNYISEFISSFTKALQEFFYVVERRNLPLEVKQRLDTGDYGYVVATPQRFVRLMYHNRRLSNQEIDDLQRILKAPCQKSGYVYGAFNAKIQMPKRVLTGVTETVFDKEAIAELIKKQLRAIEYEQQELRKNLDIIEDREKKISAAKKGILNRYDDVKAREAIIGQIQKVMDNE